MNIFSLSPFSFLSFYHFSNKEVLKLTEDRKGGRKKHKSSMLFCFTLNQKKNKGKSSGENRTLKNLVHLLLGL